MKKNFALVAALLAFAAITSLPSGAAKATSRNIFVFAQVRYDGHWDPYPGMWEEIISFLTTTTSVSASPRRKIVTLDESLFDTPVAWIFGRGEFPKLSDSQIKTLRDFFERGGMLFIDDSSDMPDSPFRRSVQNEFGRVFPRNRWERIPESHSIFKSFYLIRGGPAGRVIRRNYLEGIASGTRYAAVFSSNDIGGAWQKDKFGNYLLECVPGKDRQRWETHKLTINFILYSLTGTYKSDAVHRPFIERKMTR